MTAFQQFSIKMHVNGMSRKIVANRTFPASSVRNFCLGQTVTALHSLHYQIIKMTVIGLTFIIDNVKM